MTLWLVLMVMTSAATMVVAAPFLRKWEGCRSAFSGEVEVEVVRDQLKEVDREAADGVIDGDQIETARLEIKRRLLAPNRASNTSSARLSPAERNIAAAAIAGVIALGSISIYAIKGTPGFSSSSGSDQAAKASASDTAQLAATRGILADISREQSRAVAELATVDVMIARLVERLRQSPNDLEGWRILGGSYFERERFVEAAAAYAKAIALRPNTASLRTSRGEALVRAANGRVTDDARMMFDEALKLDGRDSRARFFKGVAKEQAGETSAAFEEWVALLNDAPADEEWIGDLKQRIAELAFDIEFGVARKARRPQAAATADTLKLLKEQYGSQPKSRSRSDGYDP